MTHRRANHNQSSTRSYSIPSSFPTRIKDLVKYKFISVVLVGEIHTSQEAVRSSAHIIMYNTYELKTDFDLERSTLETHQVVATVLTSTMTIETCLSSKPFVVSIIRQNNILPANSEAKALDLLLTPVMVGQTEKFQQLTPHMHQLLTHCSLSPYIQ